MKALIDVLKVKPCSKQELSDILKSNFSTKSKDALRHKLTRFLTKFEQLGLIEKRGDKYCWYIYVNEFEGHEDYSVKLKHSVRLIPALSRIAGIYVSRYSMQKPDEYESLEYARIRDDCAENHLRAYPDIWSLLENYRGMRERVDQEREGFNKRLMNKLEREFGLILIESNESTKLASFVVKSLPLLIYSQILENRAPSFEIDETEKIWLGGSLIAKGKQLSEKIKSFVQLETMDESNIAAANKIMKTETEAFRPLEEFRQRGRELIMRIESGEPLLGECGTCPNVHIGSERGVKTQKL